MKISLYTAIVLPILAAGTIAFWPRSDALTAHAGNVLGNDTSVLPAGAFPKKPGASIPPPITPDAPPSVNGDPLLIVSADPLLVPAPLPPPVSGSGSALISPESAAPEETSRPAPSAMPLEVLELQTAVEQRTIVATFRGNGRDKMVLGVGNTGDSPVLVHVELGQMFEQGLSAVVVTRPASVELQPGETKNLQVQTLAIRSSNKFGDSAYKLSYNKAAKLHPLLQYVAQHPEVTVAAAQTAALAIAENLPLNAISRFAPANGARSRFNTDPFRVEPIDIINALSILRDMRVPDQNVAMTIDPQLKIEAMIEPLSRAAAKKYYGISDDREWDYWKHELLAGDPSTRHYALYGIARFYPEIALEMLPKWSREAKTHPAYRLSAIQALADTQRPEALTLLRALVDDLGADSEMGRAAFAAATYLDQRLIQLSEHRTIVAFRTTKGAEAVRF